MRRLDTWAGLLALLAFVSCADPVAPAPGTGGGADGPATAAGDAGVVRLALALDQAPARAHHLVVRARHGTAPAVERSVPVTASLVLVQLGGLSEGPWLIVVSLHDEADGVLMCGYVRTGVRPGRTTHVALALTEATACPLREVDCADALDDDGDGAADCADADCTGQPCEDGDPCTAGETCAADGTCPVGVPNPCDDEVDCTADACDPALGCQHTPDDDACDDAVACTADVCDAELGCQHTPDDGACDDAVDCTVDSCTAGIGCFHAPDDVVCDDGVACTVDLCAGAAGCLNSASDGACDDGVECTVDSCDPEAGCVRAPDDGLCDDGVGCTVDTCDAEAGCGHAAEDALCDDGVECTVDTCDAQAGCGHAAEDALCDDGDACTVDTCDPESGCGHAAVVCPEGQVCADGACVAACPGGCDDGDPCTDDVCDAVDGCVHTPVAGPCDHDGDGYFGPDDGGDDCDDDDPDVHPGAPDADEGFCALWSSGWTAASVDPLRGQSGTGIDVALDGADVAHLVWFDSLTGLHLRYATNAGGTWTVTGIGEGGVDPALAIDDEGALHAARGGSGVLDTTDAGGDWETFVVAPSGSSVDVAVGPPPARAAHLCFDDQGLMHATNASGDWVVTPLATDGAVGSCGVVVDGAGAAHVVYTSVAADTVAYATDAGGAWEVGLPIDPDGRATGPVGLALDAAGGLHAVYAAGEGGLRHAWRAAGAPDWTAESVDDTPQAGVDSALAVGPDGAAHVVYGFGVGTPGLWYATDAAGAWVLTRFPEDWGEPGQDAAIVVGGDGEPRVAFLTVGAPGVWLATHAPPTCVTWGDSVDRNCDGSPGTDGDADGHASEATGGDDCDDGAPGTWPGADDTVGDGVDQDCDGVDGVDGDEDGHASEASGGDDCDDAAPATYPGAADTVGDGVDQSCDGVDGTDGDRDGHASEASGGDDCDDGAPATYPGAADTVGDGVDQDCDGVDGTDGDEDGYASEASGGDDCDDGDPTTHPGALDVLGGACGAWEDRWTRVYAEPSGAFFVGSGLAVDGAGHVHVLWVDGSPALRHATNASGAWAVETVVAEGVPATPPSVAVDRFGNVHVTHRTSVTEYLTNSSGAWTRTEIHPTGRVSALAVDALGHAHVALYDDVQYDLLYATNASGSWVTEAVDSVGVVGDGCAIAVDAAGAVHISYRDTSSGTAKYATNASGAWTFRRFARGGEAVAWGAGGTDIALDGDGHPHVAFHEVETRDARHAWYDAGGWHVETVQSAGDVGTHPTIAVDAAGAVHLAYDVAGVDGVTRYATNAGGTWAFRDIESVGAAGGYPALGVRQDGRVFVSVRQPSSYALRVFENRACAAFGDAVDRDCDGADGTDADEDGAPSRATGGDDCDDGAAAVHPGAADTVGDGIDQDCDGVDGVDADGDGHAGAASGGDDCDDALWWRHPGATDALGDGADDDCDGADGADGDDDGRPSIASGGDDCDDTRGDVYPGAPDPAGDGVDADCDGVDGVDGDDDGYASAASGGPDCADDDPDVHPGAPDLAAGACAAWADQFGAETVESAGSGNLALALDADGVAHVVTSYSSTIRHATNGSGAWTSTNVRSGNGTYLSMARDAAGALHLSWIEQTPDTLHVGRLPAGSDTWSFETVPTMRVEQLRCGAGTVDAAGVEHLVYGQNFDGGLVITYATNGSGAWEQVDVVDRIGYSADPSIAVGPDGVVHIAMRDAAARTVVYAVGDVNGFETETLVSANVSGRPDITVGPDGGIHVVWYAGTARDVGYAVRRGAGWSYEAVAHDVGWGAMTSVVAHAGGGVSILGRSDGVVGKYPLRLATNRSGSWSFGVVDDDVYWTGGSNDAVEGPDGELRVAWYDAVLTDTLYGTRACLVAGDPADSNCDGVDGVDADRDGAASTASGGGDCDDARDDVLPGAADGCDGLDNDCDGATDPGCDVALGTVGPLFVGSFAAVPVAVGTGVGFGFDDLTFRVAEGETAGSVSLSRGPDFDPAAPTVTLLARGRTGRFTLQALRGDAVVAERTFDVTLDWTDDDRGPPVWLQAETADVSTGQPQGAWGADNPAGLQNYHVYPQTGPRHLLLLFVEFEDARFPQTPGWMATAQQTWVANAETGVGPLGKSVASYYAEGSNGALQVTAEAAGPIRVPYGYQEFFRDGWHLSNKLEAVVMTAALAEIGLADVDSIVMVTPTYHILPPLWCVPTTPATEVCDGVDNDCDGLTDGWDPVVGACAAEPVCGDGLLDLGEECDDGNDEPMDACKNCRNRTTLWAHPTASVLKYGLYMHPSGTPASYGFISMPVDQETLVGVPIHATLSHEFGHNLGLVDLYEPDVPGRNLDHWDLMAWERHLPHLAVAERIRLGWIDWEDVIGVKPIQDVGAPPTTLFLSPAGRTVPDAGAWIAVEFELSKGASFYFEYRLHEAGQVGDDGGFVPTSPPGVVLGTDVVARPDVDRPWILLNDVQAGSLGPELWPGESWVLDDPDPVMPFSLRVDYVAGDADGAEIAYGYGVNRPDPAIEPWAPEPYQSPDIGIWNERVAADPAWTNTPWAGHPNTVLARVTNGGLADAPGVKVWFRVMTFNAAGDLTESQPLGSDVRDVPAGETVTFRCDDCWVPDPLVDPHYCIQARIERYVDGDGEQLELTTANNLAQSNYTKTISEVASPAGRVVHTVTVGNPLAVEAIVSLTATQTRADYRVYLDATWLRLAPGETRAVPVMVEYAGDLEAEVLAHGPRAVPSNFVHVTAWVTHPTGDDGDPSEPQRVSGATAETVTGFRTRFEALDVRHDPGVSLTIQGSVESDALGGAPVPSGVVVAAIADPLGGTRYAAATVTDGTFLLSSTGDDWSLVELEYLGAAPYAPTTAPPLLP